MRIDQDFLIKALLQHNYFPVQKRKKEEIPPIFRSLSLSLEAATEIKALPFRGRGDYVGYDQIDYKATRFNNVPRVLSIPHPKAYIDLSFELTEHWQHIEHTQDNEQSLIKPKIHRDGRIIIMDYESSPLKMKRALQMSFGKKFVAHTDISTCFPSVYSHAIPWALVGFEEAKRKSGKKWKDEWFNKIDRAQRYLKRNETLGTAIGPATSNIIVECILGKVDDALRSAFQYIRFIDDYTCYCETYEEAEFFVRRLSDELVKYKLNLNYKKTVIKQLPIQVNTHWVNDLNTHLPSTATFTYSQVVNYLDYALELQKKHPDGSILKYAIKTIQKNADSHAKGYLLEYTLTLAMHYPVLIPVLQQSIEEDGNFTYGTQLGALLNKAIENKQSDGMCWVMYYLLKIECGLSRTEAEQIIGTQDCLAITILYLFEDHQNLVVDYANALDKSDSYLLDQNWILLYQLYLNGRISNPYVGDDALPFNVLKQHNVNFIEVDV